MILAIDASTTSTGIAVFQEDELKDYGCITANKNTNVIDRIHKIIDGISQYLLKYDIDTIVLEQVHPDGPDSHSIKTYRALMWLQAAIAFYVHDYYNKINIQYIMPNTWRKACKIKVGAGYKRQQLKQQDINFVKQHYNIDANDDICDAICIGRAWNINSKYGDFLQ